MNNDPKNAQEVWLALYNLLPFVIIGGFAAMVTKVKKIYALPLNPRRRLLELVITGLVGGMVALVAVAVLPLVFDSDHTNTHLEIAAATLAGSYGQKIYDIILGRVLGHNRDRYEREN